MGNKALEAFMEPDLEHRLSTASKETGETGPVAARALDRPDAGALGLSGREPKRGGVAAGARLYRAWCDDRTRGRGDDRQHMLVEVRVDADQVIQFVCNDPIDPSASLVGSGSAGLSARKPQRQDCDESRPQGGQAPD
jgi:hypothetical protein